MSTSVTLPALGESVTEGTVSRWLKQVGDTVAADEALLEVSTDKVDTEIPSPAAGVLLEIKAEEDDTVEVGAVLAIIGDEGESAGGDSGEADSSSSDEGAAEPEQPEAAESSDEAQDERKPSAEGAPEADVAEAEAEVADEESGDEPQQSEAPKKSSGGSGGGTEVTLPALGESVTEGTVSRWLKQVGDSVEVDEALVEISTDKVDTEVPSPVAGTVLEIKAEEDDSVEVGGVLCIVGDESAAGGSGDAAGGSDDSAGGSDDAAGAEASGGAQSDAQSVDETEDQAEAGDEGGQEPIPAPVPDSERSGDAKDDAPAESEEKDGAAEKQEPAEEPEQPEAEQPEPKQETPKPQPKQDEPKQDESAKPAAPRATQDSDSTYVTPLVRKLAAENDVDLSTVEGTGVGGRIRKQDVLDAAEAAKQAAAAPAEQPAGGAPKPSQDAEKRGTTEKLTRMRKTIAKRMTESLQTSAQLTATVEVDLTEVSLIRNAVKDDFRSRNGAGLSHLAFIAKAAVEGLQQFPKVNATIDPEAGTATYAAAEHLGLAVDTERGLMVPVIHDAGDLNVSGLAKKIADVADRARTGKVTPDDLTGGTFTLTNYGSGGTLFDTPIINQPQVAILGTGAIVKRAVVISDERLGDTIAIREMMYLSLTYDHRLVDGADAARYLSAVKARLEEGDFGAEFGL